MRRRQFLTTTLSAAAAWGLPSLVPHSVFGQNAPSNRHNVGFIGLGNQSTIDLPAFLGQPDVQVLAVCDVNTGSDGYLPGQFRGRKPGQDQVNAYYAQNTSSGQYKGCDAYVDFREVLGRKDIDIVTIVVPDHWHALMTVMACQAGKDVYCEKPLSLNVSQGQAMVKAVRQYKRILQTGSQWRTQPMVRQACELVRNGRIGKLKRIYLTVAPQNAEDPGPGWKPEPVPEGFDYERWLGPAPKAPYHRGRCLYRFRFNLDYSGGQTTNFGAHSIDISRWGQGSDATGPVEFEDAGSEWPPKGSLYSTATKVAFRARYADGVEMVCETGKPSPLVRFEGTDGWVQFDSKGVTSSPDSLKTSVIGPNEFHLPVSVADATADPKKRIFYHVRNFLDAVKSRQDPIEPVEVGHRTANVCHLANIAMFLKRKIRWDPEKEQIVGDDEANRMLSRPMREPWNLL
jgi:predicted dehydrogenase